MSDGLETAQRMARVFEIVSDRLVGKITQSIVVAVVTATWVASSGCVRSVYFHSSASNWLSSARCAPTLFSAACAKSENRIYKRSEHKENSQNDPPKTCRPKVSGKRLPRDSLLSRSALQSHIPIASCANCCRARVPCLGNRRPTLPGADPLMESRQIKLGNNLFLRYS